MGLRSMCRKPELLSTVRTEWKNCIEVSANEHAESGRAFALGWRCG